MTILLGIGANLPSSSRGTPLETCRWAVNELDSLPNLRVRALSRWFKTQPVPPSGQPPYVNGVVHLAADSGVTVCPTDLLARLMAIEQAAGRNRTVRNAARPLDLDIIAIGALVRPAPDPILPHPRAHERAFVLLPLQDVAPDWVHPGLGRPLARLIAALPPAAVQESCVLAG